MGCQCSPRAIPSQQQHNANTRSDPITSRPEIPDDHRCGRRTSRRPPGNPSIGLLRITSRADPRIATNGRRSWGGRAGPPALAHPRGQRRPPWSSACQARTGKSIAGRACFCPCSPLEAFEMQDRRGRNNQYSRRLVDAAVRRPRWPRLGRNRPKSVEVRPVSRPKAAWMWPIPGQTQSKLVELGPTSVDRSLDLVDYAPISSIPAEFAPILADGCSMSVDFGPSLADSGPNLVAFGRIRLFGLPKSGRSRALAAKIRPGINQIWGGFDQLWPVFQHQAHRKRLATQPPIFQSPVFSPRLEIMKKRNSLSD